MARPMLKVIVATPESSVFTVPVAGQRSSVVLYLTMAHTSAFAAGWPSRRSLMSTFSTEFWGGLAFETPTVEPANRSATPAPTVAVGAAAGVTVALMAGRVGFGRGKTLCRAFNADRLIDRRGRMMSAPA